MSDNPFAHGITATLDGIEDGRAFNYHTRNYRWGYRRILHQLDSHYCRCTRGYRFLVLVSASVRMSKSKARLDK